MFTTLRLDTRPDAVAVLTFDQPGSKANVLTSQMWTDLEAAVDSCAARTDLKGLVLASAKPGIFIAGADLKLLADAPGPNDPAVRAFIVHGLRVLEKLEALPFPTCAAIDGAALGGGLEVALACDFRVVGTHPKVQLGMPELTLNLIPGWGGTQRLPRLVGIQNAVEVIFTVQNADAETAVNRRLADERATSEALIDAAAARVLAAGDVTAARAARRGPVPSELFEVSAPADLVNLTPAQWNRMMLSPEMFQAHRDYVNMYWGESDNRDANLAVIDVLERGASLPLADAIVVETAAFMQLAGSDGSKALIAAFFAARKKPV